MYAYTDPSLNQQLVDDFQNKVLRDTSGLAATIMSALGDRLGLFKELAARGPASSAGLADRAGIHPRYAQEWLSLMSSAGYLEYDPVSQQFALPAAHIPVLAEEGGAYFVGGTHQMLLGMMGILPHLERAFRSGEGVPMQAYDDNTWEGMERDMTGVYQANLLQKWLPAMPVVEEMLQEGVSVGDVGCGSGRVLILLSQAFPRSQYVGYEIFPPVLERARANAAEVGLAERIRFVAIDEDGQLPEQHQLITAFEVLHDAADPLGLLRMVRRSLTPDGRFVCMDINCAERLEDNTGPLETLRYGASLLYCMSTSLASGGSGLGTMGLPESKMRALCLEAGFSSLRRVTPDNAAHNVYEATP